MTTRARFVTVVAWRRVAGVSWEDAARCGAGRHHSERVVEEGAREELGEGHPPNESFPTCCDTCGQGVPDSDAAHCFVAVRPVYDTASGRPEPGDLYSVRLHEGRRGYCPGRWSDCDGLHLLAVLPDGSMWDVDGRASNCAMPHDNLHRCWVRHGEPPTITVDKAGRTCAAGAGSVAVGTYHGFLRDGCFT